MRLRPDQKEQLLIQFQIAARESKGHNPKAATNAHRRLAVTGRVLSENGMSNDDLISLSKDARSKRYR